ncbi:MAG: creatininase family protein [Myxococcota bacterium]
MRRLLDLPHAEARAQLREGTVWLPVNPVEYHGPHLPLHTDGLLSLGWLGDLHRAAGLPGAPLVASDLEVGVEPTPGPGSRAFGYRAVRDVAARAADALVALGAQRIALVTFHGAPLHNLALAQVVRRLGRQGVRAVAPFQELTRLLGSFAPVAAPLYATLPDDDAREGLRASLDLDFHAGFVETSLMLHRAPGRLRRPPELAPLPHPARAGAAALARAPRHRARPRRSGPRARVRRPRPRWTALRPFPGYTGLPALANPEAGRIVAAFATERVAPVVARVLLGGEPAPAPPFRWAGPLTLWGALGP